MVMDAGLETRIFVQRADGFILDIELAIAAGRTTALLGPNGAGKSTVVAAISGLLPLDKGYIRLGERTLDDPAAHRFVAPEDRGIGVVFQDYLLFPHLTVAQNIAFGLRHTGAQRSVADKRTSSWLRKLGIHSLADRRPADLSGGQAQRVALARALIIEPDLLLLDEPLAALDVTTRTELRHTLAEHLEQFPGPRLLITHDPAEAFLLANEVHIIEHGSISQIGTADDIRLRPRSRYAADLAGSNLLLGTASDGVVTVGSHQLHIADARATGPVLVSVHPRAISLHRHQPHGSPRNTWATSVSRIEHYGDRVRLQTGDPLSLTAEVTPEAVADLALGVGLPVWVSLKATEIGVESA